MRQSGSVTSPLDENRSDRDEGYDDRNRFMSPALGRFLQPDPIGFKGDASNLYRYCGNDWANRSDPMGLDSTEHTIANSIEQKKLDVLKDHDRDLRISAMAKSWIWKTADPVTTILGRSAIESLQQQLGTRSAPSIAVARMNWGTPIPNPRSKSRAEVKWGGETDPVYESPEAINAHHAGYASYTRRDLHDPTGRYDAGKVSITQVVTATRHLPYGSGPGSYLWDQETKRVEAYHGATNDANARAQTLAVRGFRDVDDGIRSVRESTQQVFDSANLDYGFKYDVLKQGY